MKELILSTLKTMYPNLGFTDKAFDGVATFGATLVTDATQIETWAKGVEPLLKGFQGDADSRVKQAIKTNDEKHKKSTEEPKTEDPKTDPKTETATEKLLKTLTESVLNMGEEIKALKTGEVTKTWKTQLEEGLKDAPEEYKTLVLEVFDSKKGTFASDADFETFKTEKIASVSKVKKAENEQNLQFPKPVLTLEGKDGKQTSDFGEMMRNATESKLKEKEAAAAKTA